MAADPDKVTGGAGIGPAGATPAGARYVNDPIFEIDGEGTTAFSGDADFDVGLVPNPGAKTFQMRRHDKPFKMKRG